MKIGVANNYVDITATELEEIADKAVIYHIS